MPDPTREFEALLKRMITAICAAEADAAAACFTVDGTYHDGFYGEFHGRAEIARMVRECFHGNARALNWDVFDCCANASLGYASYTFRYLATMPGYEAKPVVFTGMCRCRLQEGLIKHYSEVFERSHVLAQLNFPDERILRSIRKWSARAAG